ncbi:DUF397 domain-containing protein [Streptomyces tsukubensis]
MGVAGAARPTGDIAILDSKAPAGPVVEISRETWNAFLEGVKAP